ncbi:MAG: hypothetical protein ACRENP_07340 [Longimicrobiales bacterium]
MKLICSALIVGAALGTESVAAQFSSEFPGVPRAAVPLAGARQSRSEFDLLYFNVPAGTGRDSLAVGMRIGLGRSWRIRSRFEVGFDFSLLEGMHVRERRASSSAEAFPHYTRGNLGYGLKVGAKFTPLNAVSPEGYGYHAGIGVAFQPSLEAVFGVAFESDTIETGGVFVKNTDGADNVLNAIPQSIQVAAMGSYRTRRIALDGALLWEKTEETSPIIFPIERYSGVSLHVGAKYHLTRSIAPALLFWGGGAPPWRDRILSRAPGEQESQWGVAVSFGSKPEAGTDLMLMSPTGSLSNSVRLYIRVRSTT